MLVQDVGIAGERLEVLESALHAERVVGNLLRGGGVGLLGLGEREKVSTARRRGVGNAVVAPGIPESGIERGGRDARREGTRARRASTLGKREVGETRRRRGGRAHLSLGCGVRFRGGLLQRELL